MLNKMDESGRGYICLDCQNTEAFDATSDLYRLYKREDKDFEPFRLALVQIVSKSILVQNANGLLEEDSRYKNGRYIAI